MNPERGAFKVEKFRTAGGISISPEAHAAIQTQLNKLNNRHNSGPKLTGKALRDWKNGKTEEITREELIGLLIEASLSPEERVAINSIYNQHPRLFKKINKWEKRSLRWSKVKKALRLSKNDDLDDTDDAFEYSTKKAHKWLNRRKGSPEYKDYAKVRGDLESRPR